MADIPIPTDPSVSNFDLKQVSADNVPVTSAATLDTDLSSETGRNLGKARLMDSGETLIDPLDSQDMAPESDTTTDSGESNAATITLGNHRTSGVVTYDTSDAATITLEGSNDDGDTWTLIDEFDPDSDTVEAQSVDLPYHMVRAHIDQNVNELSVAAKGI